jgi:hypothetical protein
MFREVSSFRFKSTSQGMAARGAEFKGGSHYTSGLEGSEFAVFSGDRANWLGKIEMLTMEVHPTRIRRMRRAFIFDSVAIQL